MIIAIALVVAAFYFAIWCLCRVAGRADAWQPRSEDHGGYDDAA
jgi:hypothetical protein